MNAHELAALMAENAAQIAEYLLPQGKKQGMWHRRAPARRSSFGAAKDANDYLLAGATPEEFRRCIAESKTFDPDELCSISDFWPAVKALFYPAQGDDHHPFLRFGDESQVWAVWHEPHAPAARVLAFQQSQLGATRMRSKSGIEEVSDIRVALIRRFEISASHGFETVLSSMSDAEREETIKRNYETFAIRVALGVDDWHRSSPYEIADWLRVLTEPEFGAWQDIRSAGLPLWPRLPVGNFVVSFGNPVSKVALQCGGESDDMAPEDLRVDHWLKQIGWRVFRAPYERCLRVMETPSDIRERTGECDESYRASYLTDTLAGTILEVRHALIAAGAPL